MNNLRRFKYSFTALFATIVAIVVNLLCDFSIITLAVVSLILLTGIFICRYFAKNYNITLIFVSFFIVGLTSSAIYNAKFRVYPVPDYLNGEKAWVVGTIEQIKQKNKYSRIYLNSPEIYSELAKDIYIPKIIISTFSSRLKDAKVGDELVTKVLLQRPNKKLFADDFDYGEYLLQNGINLTGQVRGSLYITPPENDYSFFEKFANYRLNIAEKIGSESQPQALATALITGIRGKINNKISDDFKKSGLAHLMAISGMHMAFLAGIIFLIVRYAVCLIPVLALHFDSRKIAGIATIAVAFGYLLLAGASLPTVRAFAMIALFIVTVILNRNRISLHTLAVVAIGILLLDPVAIFSASFQLSFSAVFAMLLYNELKPKEIILDFSKKAKLWRAFIASLNISIIAFSATVFVVSVHFGYLSVFAIVANVVASILMGLVIMPALFIYFVGFIVFDIQVFSLFSEYSLTLLLNLADCFAKFENSSVYISSEYSIVLLFIAFAVLAVIIFNYGRKYLITFGLFFVAFIIPIKFDLRPQIIELSNGSLGLRNGNELILLGSLEKRDLVRVERFYNLKNVENNLDKTCDITGCVYNFTNKLILQTNSDFPPTQEDLRLVDYVVEYY